MTRIYTLIIYLAALTASIAGSMALTSCEDHLEAPGYEDIPAGMTSVNFSFTFPDYTPALESRSAGDAMGKIRTLWIAVYRANGEYVEKFEVTDFTSSMEGRPENEETPTGCAKFRMTYPNGRYRMYAIANHDLSSADVSTEDKLMHLPLTWQDDAATGIDHNDQMFGWFLNSTDKPEYDKPNAYSVVIKPGMDDLHAWVRRAASKLTVAFNTDRLNENVKIYLKSISLIDIPAQCYLHSPNNLGEEDYRLKNEFAPRTASSTIYFQGAEAAHIGKDDHLKWPEIGAGDLVFGLAADAANTKHNTVITLPEGQETNSELYQQMISDRIKELIKIEHAQTVRALYFYENMQAPGTEGTASDKRQIVGEGLDVAQNGDYPSYPNGNYGGSHNEDGSLKDDAYDGLGWKDARPWGTYVEIKGYYENETGKGDITYRFMLGKNTTTNYEAERNHHYKLTLVFNGNANDVDFHIDYEEEAKPGLFTPTETYVPYLYNQESTTTIRATPREGYDLLSLKAIILDNEWRPHEGSPDVDYWKDAWDAQIEHRRIDTNRDYTQDFTKHPKDDPEAAENCEFGFLSLWKMKAVTRDAGGSADPRVHTTIVNNLRDFYFKHVNEKKETVSCGAREYTNVPTANGQELTTTDADGNYTITRTVNPTSGEIDYVATIPLYTRAKTLDPWAVYSGANPFYEHSRYARIKFIATYKKVGNVTGPDEYSDVSYTNVLQSRRIDNPRGIYRSDNNLQSFHVNLKYMKSGGSFEPVVSRGPWTAIIESDPDGLVSISANGQRAEGQGSSITGRTNTEIDFMYRPLKTATTENPRGAIITVLYHNNSCVHKIIVKQGYGATSLGSGTTKFSMFNVYDSKSLVKNPLSPGSFFRAYNDLSYPIAEANDLIPELNLPNKPTSSSKYKVHDKGSLTWDNIGSWNNSGNYDPFYSHSNSFNSFSLERHDGTSSTYKLPTYRQTRELGFVDVGKEENEDNDINFAFGITYGDGASSTLENANAYSFSDPDNTGNPSEKGMRGIIIYSKSQGDNIFFPMGSLGHGRRRNLDITNGGAYVYGLHRYGDLDNPMTGNTNIFRPMAWNLCNQFGAVYWTSDQEHSIDHPSDTSPYIALDFNYGNYMVGRGKSTQYSANGKKWDALLLRLVQTD
ncbi:MAG: hypothetical protein HDS91_02285 [Bacteroidales bacterium]|nr:hypothetical protein [Bacteroidales bacterium]